MNAYNAVVGAVQMAVGASVAYAYWKSNKNQRAWKRAQKEMS